MYIFNRFMKNGKATIFNFYLQVHVEDKELNKVAIQVGINDVLRYSSQ